MTSRPDSIDRLQTALDRLAGALHSGGPDDVLAVEAELADAVQAFQADRVLAASADAHLRRRLLDLRLALRRCEVLGSAVAELASALRPGAYDRAGRTNPHASAYRVAEVA